MNALKHFDELLSGHGRYTLRKKQKTRTQEFFCVVYTDSTTRNEKTQQSPTNAFATAPAVARSPRLETIPENEIFMFH
ncbi:hypothetical protein TRVA0_035S00210 [Trichomonascus vanleenenianus]|uniref:uncharacterized protein n=1 Tax=Trichomonascus vanleenenianus TaxID=2268995 RepID=UPI003ECA099B